MSRLPTDPAIHPRPPWFGPHQPLDLGPAWSTVRAAFLALPGGSSAALARWLGVHRNRVSGWTTGSDPGHAQPPLWAVWAVAAITGHRLVLAPNGCVQVVRAKRR